MIRILKKLIADKDITGVVTWVELLSRTLHHIHDMLGEVILFLYEMGF